MAMATDIRASAAAERTLEEWAAGWSAHDAERVAALFTDDCLYEDATMGVVNRGKEELRGFARAILEAFPDFTIDLTSRFAAGDWAATEWTMAGTHRGDLPGLPATGKRFSLRGSTVVELRQDKIKRLTDYWDMASFLKQIGAMPDR
jgi:steroid delta-isomerase-like uncharacterized protein